MKKAFVIATILLIAAQAAFAAPTAILTALKGKVEVRPDKGSWQAAKDGMKIDRLTTISTGFDSTATIVIDKTRIVVKPLTRLTLDKLVEQAGSVATSLFLRVGSVQASVKAATPGQTQDFQVQSPYSTASVRGTEFSFDGIHLQVIDGVVRLIPGRPTRPVQVSSSPAASSEGQPGEGQPGEGQPGEGQPGEGQPGEGQPGEGQPGEGQPGEGQPGEGQPGEGQPGEGQPGEGSFQDDFVGGASDAANTGMALDVVAGQNAFIQVAYAMDTGAPQPPASTGGGSGGSATAPAGPPPVPYTPPAPSPTTGGVVISWQVPTEE